MRLAAKLVLLFLLGMLLIVFVFSYLTVQMDRRLAIAEHERHATELAEAVQRSEPAGKKSEASPQLPKENTPWNAMQIQQSRIRRVYVNAGDERYRPAVPDELIIAERQTTTLRFRDESGRQHLVTYLVPPNGSQDDTAERLEISSPDTGAEDRLRRSVVSSLVALSAVATLSGLVIVLGGVKMVGKPLNQLIDKVHRVGEGDFSGPVQVQSKDELGRLGQAINQMCDQLQQQRFELEAETASRIEAVEQLRHAERLNMVGRMAAGIAHEIGTPLNVVSGRAELIAGGMLSDDAVRESARTIQSESQRITKIIRHLLDFARQSTPQRSHHDLNQLLSVTTSLMEPLAAKHHIKIQLRLPESPVLAEVDPAQIQQVLINLIANAVQTIKNDGDVTITVDEMTTTRPGTTNPRPEHFARIAVTDNGCGIAEEDMEHLFEPFFTTKDVGEGTGLGLSITHGIVQEHQGWITVDSEEDKGSTFSIYLPASRQHDIDKAHKETV